MAIAAAAVAVVGGVVQTVSSAKQAKNARNAIKNYKRQELKNAYGDLTVSTRGAELQREELARASATSIQALRSGGIRGVVGGVGQVQQSNMLQSRVIGADLDRQRKQIEQLRATDEVRMQQATERREEADLAGLGQQLQAGRQGVMNGISTATQGVGAAAGIMGGGATGAVGKSNPYLNASGDVMAKQTTAVNPFEVMNPQFVNTPQAPGGYSYGN